MISILFPPGSFGSTIEYSIRRFSDEFLTIDSPIQNTGSMHGFQKEFHPVSIAELENATLEKYNIITPVYPGTDYLSPVETVQRLKNKLNQGKIILIYFSNLRQAERNQLFSFYKIDYFINKVIPNSKAKCWNQSYRSVNDMKPWELREALSFYIDQLTDYLQVDSVAEPSWLLITPEQILTDFSNTIQKILVHCNLTFNESNIDNFFKNWLSAQQYIIDEFHQIDIAVNCIDSKKQQRWEKLSVMGEAIVQSRLRRQGINIACEGLEQFPTTADDLIKILIN